MSLLNLIIISYKYSYLDSKYLNIAYFNTINLIAFFKSTIRLSIVSLDSFIYTTSFFIYASISVKNLSLGLISSQI